MISEGGWIEREGCRCFNLYRPPAIEPGNAAEADPWLDHARKVFGDDADHILRWLAHRVQRPADKINHALVLGGGQGIGKDTLLAPVKAAVGPWNFHEVSPQHMLARFNGFLRSVVLRVSEARDLGDVNRFQFYDHLKAYTAAPPDVLRCDEKHLREYTVLNCCGVIITTNHKADGIYLPPDDRRHFVAWSDLPKQDFVPATGIRSGGGMPAAATAMSPPTSPSSTSASFDSEGAATQDAGVLGHRRRQPGTRGRRARRRAGQARTTRTPPR